jgi:hypothetical protein
MGARAPVTCDPKLLRPAAIASLALLLSCGDARAEGGPTEYEVKSAFLYNFAKFIEWPSSTFEQTGGSMVVGILGADPFGPALERIAATQQVQGRKIVIRRATGTSELGFCHLLFVGSVGPSGTWSQTIRAASGPSRLLVGDGAEFAEHGGAIGFFLDERRVRFVVNLSATDRAGLKVSSKLLKIALVMRGP